MLIRLRWCVFQRIGYNGYPELLSDIREQVRSEIYAAYMPRHALADSKAALFKARVEQERQNLSQMLVHNPPEHVDAVVEMLNKASHIVLMAEGYADGIADHRATVAPSRLFGRSRTRGPCSTGWNVDSTQSHDACGGYQCN